MSDYNRSLIDSPEGKIFGEYSPERLLHAEKLIELFAALAMQGNHFGKNEACPTCHAMAEMKKYFERWVDVEKFKEEHAECIKEFVKNPKKIIFS